MYIKRLRFLSILFLSSLVLSALAVPAKRGVWRTVKLVDGTDVRVELCGDERAHWWQSADGVCYVHDAATGLYKNMDQSQLQAGAKRYQSVVVKEKMARAMRRAQESGSSTFQGEKRGLIILAEFPNQSFTYDNVRALYDRIANEKGYSDHGFNGSIRDYFTEQSGGQFSLSFDVAGPVMMSHDYSYYGRNGEARAPEMIREACQGVDSLINFADYDWDGDGEVEEVFVLYAGHGQADYDTDNDDLIWPHMYYVNTTGYSFNDFRLDGKKVDVYACSSELNGSGGIAGIGTFCHEFSHCMGFPDMYDTGKAGNYGMGSWDLMDYGSYNGDGYTPAGYSGYEKMVCGWTKPIELTKDTVINSVRPMSQMGQSYIVYNQGNRNECYILTNRQRKGYDAEIPGHGMLIEHIDYDENVWYYNIVNTTDNNDYASYGVTNDHQRITIFHANNRESTYYQQYAAYPYNGNDSLTNSSTPAAKVYNANSDGSFYMNYAIKDIAENADGTVSFKFGKSSSTGTPVEPVGDVLFKETFDKCDGNGGNDGIFKGLSSRAYTFKPDNEGWESEMFSGGDRCAWFGNGSTDGYVVTPPIKLDGDTVTLSFRAAGWGAKKDGTNLDFIVYEGDGQFIDATHLALTKGEFKQYNFRLIGSGSITVQLACTGRFFLDDVYVTKNAVSTGIKAVNAASPKKNGRIYTIGGQLVGNDLRLLPHGIYIVEGRKIVK